MIGLATTLAGAAAGCGGNELFTPQLGSNELVLDRTATTWLDADQHWFEQVTVVGDLDGDGIDDAIVSPHAFFPTGDPASQQFPDDVYILYGGTAVTGEIKLETLPSLAGFGEVPLVAPVGDVDGDGLADVVISYNNDYSCLFNPGAGDDERHGGAFLIYGDRNRLTGLKLVDDVAVFLRDPLPCTLANGEVKLGDLDGDGKADWQPSPRGELHPGHGRVRLRCARGDRHLPRRRRLDW